MTRPTGDHGETLVELLVSITIMAIAMPAILGGVLAGVMVSDIHRKQAAASADVRDYAERIEWYVTTSATGYGSDYAPATVGYDTKDAGYLPSVVSVQCWNGTTFGGCAIDLGAKQVTIAVASRDNRATEQLTVVVRKP